MFKQVDYVMAMVSDMDRAVEFYRDKLGLPLKFQSPGWTEFNTGATTLALHGGGTPQQRPATTEEGSQQAGTCWIGFSVADLEKVYEELRARGVVFSMPPTVRENEGINLAVCLDPDGLPVSFAELLQQQP